MSFMPIDDNNMMGPVYAKLNKILPPHPVTGQHQPLIKHLNRMKPTGTIPDYYSNFSLDKKLDLKSRYPDQYNKDTNPNGVVY
jgi:hypothetical protein